MKGFLGFFFIKNICFNYIRTNGKFTWGSGLSQAPWTMVIRTCCKFWASDRTNYNDNYLYRILLIHILEKEHLFFNFAYKIHFSHLSMKVLTRSNFLLILQPQNKQISLVLILNKIKPQIH